MLDGSDVHYYVLRDRTMPSESNLRHHFSPISNPPRTLIFYFLVSNERADLLLLSYQDLRVISTLGGRAKIYETSLDFRRKHRNVILEFDTALKLSEVISPPLLLQFSCKQFSFSCPTVPLILVFSGLK